MDTIKQKMYLKQEQKTRLVSLIALSTIMKSLFVIPAYTHEDYNEDMYMYKICGNWSVRLSCAIAVQSKFLTISLVSHHQYSF